MVDQTPNEAATSPLAILVSADLMFTSRVSGAAGSLGFRCTTLSSANAAMETAESTWPNCGCLFVDLETPGLDIAALLGRLPTDPRPKVVAYGPHVHTAKLEAAQDAGCDEVLSRGQFSASVGQLLKKYLG